MVKGNTRGRKTLRSTIVVPQNEDNSSNNSTYTYRSSGEKRSRSEGDETRDRNFEIKSLKLDENKKRDSLPKTNTGDLREKLDEMKKRDNSRSKSRSRSRSRQRSSPRKSNQSPVFSEASTHSDKRSMSNERKSTDISEEYDSEDNKKENTRSKFTSERRIETVTTPTRFDIFEGMQDDEDTFNNFRDTEEGSEVIFNRKKSTKEKSKDSSDEGYRHHRKSTPKKKHKKRKQSKRRSKKRKRYQESSSSEASTSDSSSENTDEEERRNRKRKRKLKKKQNLIYDSSTDEDEESETEKINTLVKQLTKKEGKRSGKEGDKMSRIVKQVVEQLNKDKSKNSPSNNSTVKAKETIKSPSEPTIYQQAISKGTERERGNPRFFYHDASPQLITRSYDTNKPQIDQSDQNDKGIELIDHFIKSIRLEHEDGEAAPGTGATTSKEDKTQRDRVAYAKEISDKAIIEAEKSKAKIQLPEGKSEITHSPFMQRSYPEGTTFNSEINRFRQLLQSVIADNDDDDFFHITCHLDQQLITKIQKGGYVELEKLLQKPEHLRTEIDNRQVLINKDGEQYYVPYRGKDSVKISGVKKWEQAFRIYAAIYCQKNPERSVEILQYVDIINQAATKFSWEKVAKYDFIFRHLMDKKPTRSWAKTYTQGWTLELTGGDNKQQQSFNKRGSSSYNSYSSNTNGNGQTSSTFGKSWKDNCCWKYNKGDNCPYGKECRFDHRCTFCGSYSHPSMHCEKKSGHHSSKSPTEHKKSKGKSHKRSSNASN